MKERFAFWKGVTAGIFGGIAIGALTRLSAAEADRLSDSLPAPDRRYPVASQLVRASNERPKLSLRRDGAESAGDPRMTGPVSTLGAISGRAFERPPGAPGGRTPAEVLAAPGRPGQTMDHTTGHATQLREVEEEAVPAS
jgi:hypothetical protein